MSAPGLIDWALARRIAVRIAGPGGGSGPFDQAAIDSACADAIGLVSGYAELEPSRALPAPELIDRAEWVSLAAASLGELSAELDERIVEGLRLPGPLGGLARSVAGAAVAAEAGAAIGFASRKVLGQYDLALAGPERPPRLVFVGPNLASAHAQLGEDPGLFLRWIAIHETTHSVQFASVPWLRGHLADLLGRLIAGASVRLDQTTLRAIAGKLIRSDPRKVIQSGLRGELPRLLAGPEQAGTLDALQATMSVIEGHAEHVMDAAGAALEPGYARLRDRLDAKRAERGGLAEVISRLLGMEQKLRQYKQGKEFCDAVAEQAGIEGLNVVWSAPAALPSLEELERPADWLRRARALAHA